MSTGKQGRNLNMCGECLTGKHRSCTRPWCSCVCWDITVPYAIHPEGRGEHSRGVCATPERVITFEELQIEQRDMRLELQRRVERILAKRFQQGKSDVKSVSLEPLIKDRPRQGSASRSSL